MKQITITKHDKTGTVVIKKHCPACRQNNKNPKPVTFRRFHKYDKQYNKFLGFVCKCGYVVAEEQI